MNETCFKLLEPGKIGRLELKNRIILAPMGTIVGNLGPGELSTSSSAPRAASAC